ncbi:hypothetical protein EBS80_00725 [bacterium]|nr:hypothetical protein [bacterium]
MNHVRAPQPYSTDAPIVFLAGSIEMGAARPWQDEVVASLADLDVTVLNPRRQNWDPFWQQHPDNPEFREQVEWELDGLQRANLILMYFDPDTKSPVSMMELGLFHGRNLIVCCPDGFWRKGNVSIVCERFGITLCRQLPELVEAARTFLS